MLENLVEMIKPALIGLAYVLAAKYAVVAIGSLVSRFLDGLDYLKAKANENKYLKMTQIDDFFLEKLGQAVLATKGMLVDRLKRDSADGKLSEKEALDAKEAAFQTFKDSLSQVELKEILSVLGDDLKKIAMAKIPFLVELLKPVIEKPLVGELLSTEKDSQEGSVAPLADPS